jgi:DedD protein
MAKQLTDEELNLRRKLRRRLIGAAALMLAVVVILPMVLDSEPKTTGEDIDLRIPAPDKVGEFVPGKAVEKIVESPASAVVASSVASTVIETAPVVAPTLPITRSVPPAVEIPAVQAPAKPPVKAADTSPSVLHQSASDNAASGAGFVAQIGAYSNADTAKHELAKLKAWGFKAYTEKAGDKIRVRVGPYAERDKAEKVRHMLEKHGLHPVVTPAK